jgi:uncharacterized protein (TIGR02271 family)
MNKKDDKSRNPDPITGAPGSHPVGTGVGAAAGGAATGAAVGSVAGPVGTAAGVAAGAVIGGLAGKGVAEKVNPTQEDTYWQHNHYREPYGSRPYREFRNAYRAGYEGYATYGTGTFEEREADLRRRYEADPTNAKLPWTEARHAARAAWHRLERNPERLIDYDVLDSSGASVGKVNSVWADAAHQPVFLGVKTGWVFGKTHVVPVHTTAVNTVRRTIQLPFTEAQIKDAPSFAAESDLTDANQTEIYRHYGVQAGASCAMPEDREKFATTDKDRSTDKERTLALHEEKLKVGKREVEAGGIRIRKIVRTETVRQPVTLRREDYVVERVPASQVSDAGRAIEEEDIFLPLRREEAVIEKDVTVREGVKIGRKSETETQTVTEQVRREDIEVERRPENRTDQPRKR